MWSCKSNNNAIGPEDRIYVIADSLTYMKLKDALEFTFEKTIYTPQPEKTFILLRKDYADLKNLKKFKNIILIDKLNTSSPESEFISSLLDKKMKVQSGKDTQFVFIKNDLWKKDQMVMILTNPDIEQLKKNILKHNTSLMNYFHKESGKRIFNEMVNSGYEKKDVEAKLYKDYGWKIFVPENFYLALNIPKDNFVWLRSNIGDDFAKLIFIHWIENASPELLTPDSILNIRDELTKKYFRSGDDKAFVRINQNFKKTDEVNFNGHYALASQGLWEMNDKSRGGPFINYTFYDEKTKRIYMLDGSLYAPKYYKKDLIQQLDVILQSFTTKK
jgi:hypothetical protein